MCECAVVITVLFGACLKSILFWGDHRFFVSGKQRKALLALAARPLAKARTVFDLLQLGLDVPSLFLSGVGQIFDNLD